MKKVCEPFPLSWCRNVDFLPILSAQSKLNKKQKIYYFEGTVSMGSTKALDHIRTELGVTISPSATDRNAFDIIYGDIIPNLDSICDPLEIWNSTLQELPETPEIVIHSKGIVHDIPKNILNESAIDGAEYLYHKQSSVGNQYNSLRRKINLPIVNPYIIAKAGLLENENFKFRDPCFKRIRSVLKTEWIKPSNDKGWYELQHILFKLERGLRGKIEGRKSGNNWWEDTAQPMYFGGHINHTDLNVRVCMLDDRHRLIGI